ncbi:hypothetical protein [Acidovorax sp. A1169]|uniref:hypothetical protein n=1 Tax=Acidovorax sp. A1169 TaxID=3059524 RepID=UPI002737D55B|nr:hypothetical protein [Acidovorax sp. A1169]MDP4078267.1 hypothetical protein [Acidovorax sp. A1169]
MSDNCGGNGNRMRSWHDYHLTGYAVDGQRQQLTLHVAWLYGTHPDIPHAWIIFHGVEGYFLENDLGVNVVYTITEEPLAEFLAQHAAHFEAKKKWGWPLFWRGSFDETLAHLSGKQAKCFEISSSYGMTGWVLASGVRHEVITSYPPAGAA